MASDLMWLAYHKNFELDSFLCPIPFEWDPGIRKMTFISKRAHVAGAWFQVGIVGLAIVCYIFTLLYTFTLPTWTIEHYIQIIACVMAISCFSIVFTMSQYYTRNGELMAALFTDGNRAFASGMNTLQIKSKDAHQRSFSTDILGRIMYALAYFQIPATITGIVLGLYLNIDCLMVFGVLKPRFTPLGLVEFITRVMFVSCILAILLRWTIFFVEQLVLVLHVGNAGFDLITKVIAYPHHYRHLPQRPELFPTCGNNHKLLEQWQQFVISIIGLSNRILLQCRMWSYYIGHLIFILTAGGCIFWATANYAMLTLGPRLDWATLAALGFLSFLCFVAWITLASHVANIEKNSTKFNALVAKALCSNKLGRRYVAALATAKIITPMFGFTEESKITVIRQPFDLTINLVLTFTFSL